MDTMRLGRAAFAIAVSCGTTALVAACLFPSLDDLEGGGSPDSTTLSDSPASADGMIDGRTTDGPGLDGTTGLLGCEGAVAIWPLDEDGGYTVHECKGRFNGTFDDSGAVRWVTIDGGGALAVDAGVVHFDDPSGLLHVGGGFGNARAFTATAWIRAYNPAVAAYFLSRSADTEAAWAIGLFQGPTGGTVYFGIRMNPPTGEETLDREGPAFSAEPRWIHTAVVFDGSREFKFYIDGALNGGGKVDAGEWQPGIADFELGKITAHSDLAYHGPLRDVRLYDRALSDTDVHAIFSGP